MRSRKLRNFGIKHGYKSRLDNQYYEDYTGTTSWQPDVYTAVVKLARLSGASTIIDIGSGNGEKVMPYKNDFSFVFLDFGSNLKLIKKNIGKGNHRYLDQDFEKGFPKFPKSMLEKSVVVCSDVLEHMRKPEILVNNLVKLSQSALFVVISTPDRTRTRGISHFGPAQNQTHVREWSLEELDTLFRFFGMENQVAGITRSNDYEQVRRTSIILSGKYFRDIAEYNEVKIEIYAHYSPNINGFANNYYIEQGIVRIDNPESALIQLKDDEWLATPNPELKLGSIISDAKAKGFGIINAQVINLKPEKYHSWPEAGIIRQGHGIMGLLGEVQPLRLNPKSNKLYPLQLTIFRKGAGSIKNKNAPSNTGLIDTGHLEEYLLETLVGWDILKY